MIFLNCGNKWNMEFLDKIIELNKKYSTSHGIIVKELYGNPQDSILSGVRPDARIPKISKQVIKDFIEKANKYEIEINFTLNKSCIGNISELDLDAMQNVIKEYEDMGVTRFTLYSPYLLTNLSFKACEISTIHNNTNINYLIGISKLNPTIDKICLPIYINRQFNKLRKCVSLLPNPELIVNEFCVSYKNICYYRNECYNIQSHNQNIPYPFKECSMYRKEHSLSWLKAPFILPQWLKHYQELFGISRFKLTGRTHSTSSLLNIIEIYLKQEYEGPVHLLWGEGLPYQDLSTDKLIYAKDLQELNYFHKLVSHNHDCENLICDLECQFCGSIMRQLRSMK